MPPLGWPVACRTTSGSARRTIPPARRPTLPLSTRFTPDATTMIGAPFTVNTSDFAICPTSTPSAAAASWDVRAVFSSSITRRSSPRPAMAACPRSAAAFIGPSERQLRHHPQSLGRLGPADEGGDARRLPALEPLANALLGAAQRDLVHEGVRHRGGGVLLLPREVQILDAPGLALVAIARHEVVVEVLPPRPHAPHVQRPPRPPFRGAAVCGLPRPRGT